MSEDWFYSKGSEKLGPVSDSELRAMAADGRLAADDLIWKEGLADWVPARSAKGLFQAQASAPPPLPPHGRPPRARDAGAGVTFPAWAKVVVATAGAVVVLVVVGISSDRGRRRAPPATSSSMAPAPNLPPPAVDPRGLVGGWVFGTPDGAGGSSGFIMSLNRDLTFAIEMMKVDAAGRTTTTGSLAGTWIVTGDRLVFTSPDGADVIVHVIVESAGDSLTLQDVESGMLKPMQRLPR